MQPGRSVLSVSMMNKQLSPSDVPSPFLHSGLNTLVIPRKAAAPETTHDTQPYVYLKCGHVQGLHEWGQSKTSNAKTCPMCMCMGPVVKLTTGIEPSFCLDCLPPTYAFNPCGHMASDATVRYVELTPFSCTLS